MSATRWIAGTIGLLFMAEGTLFATVSPDSFTMAACLTLAALGIVVFVLSQVGLLD